MVRQEGSSLPEAGAVVRWTLAVNAALLLAAACYLAWSGAASALESGWIAFSLIAVAGACCMLLYVRSWRGIEGTLPEGWLVATLAGGAVLCQIIPAAASLDFRGWALLAAFCVGAVGDDYLSLARRPEPWLRLRYLPVLAAGWFVEADLFPPAWLLLLLATAVPSILSGDRYSWAVLALAILAIVALFPGPAVAREIALPAAGSVLILALASTQAAVLVDRRRRAEQRLEFSEAVYREIFDAGAEGIMVVDQDSGRLLQVNRKAAAFLEKPATDLLGAPLDQVGSAEGWLRRLLADPGAAVTLEPGSLSGYRGWIEAQSMLCEIGGKSRGLIVMRDVSSRIAADQDRKRLEEELLRTQKMEGIGRLAGGIAHDFNNLLTVINGRAELAASLLEQDHPALHELTVIRQAGLRAAELTARLLAFSRQQTFQLAQTSLNEVIEEMAPTLRRVIGEDVKLEMRLDPGLRPARVDVGSMQQVLLQLAVNAREAMSKGGRLLLTTANLVVDAKPAPDQPADLPPGRFVTLTVEDNGGGMDSEVLKRIFEPFFTTKQVGQGAGLGLSVVHGMIQQHGGRIAVHSVPGAGTTFKIYLPAADPLPGDVEDVARRFAQGR